MAATTTERTSKPLKAAQGCGCLLALTGLAGTCAAYEANEPPDSTRGLLILGGLLLFGVARAMAWWQHE